MNQQIPFIFGDSQEENSETQRNERQFIILVTALDKVRSIYTQVNTVYVYGWGREERILKFGCFVNVEYPFDRRRVPRPGGKIFEIKHRSFIIRHLGINPRSQQA